MTTYISFPRGINVGGRTIPMADMKQAFEALGLKNVKTFLASGNIKFDTTEENTSVLNTQIEEHLTKIFHYPATVITRKTAQLAQLATENPFKDITVTPNTRLYVTFLPDIVDGTTRIAPQENENVTIVKITKSEVCIAITITPDKNTTDLMKGLEKSYGKNITTRNWNTITRILKS